MKQSAYFETLKMNGVAVVKVVGPLDESCRVSLFKALNAVAERQEPLVKLDFQGASVVSSAAARVIFNVLKQHAGRFTVAIKSPQPDAEALLRTCGLGLLPNVVFLKD